MKLAAKTLALATKKPKSQKSDLPLTRSSRSTRRWGLETIVGVWIHLRRDGVAQDADPFDLDLHDVPWFEVARRESIAYRLANRSAGDRTAPKYVARNYTAIP